eukprot:TRINITY_DN4678_c0_g1_i1.p1 TRINITY_DN4678_c0_g1~~TRINITY_DN4678_c0_g1_i1.p1  ORF type:complete len:245 (+),score=56.56 TRINITY_DN4678_c0_g1_i1:84-818(+)
MGAQACCSAAAVSTIDAFEEPVPLKVVVEDQEEKFVALQNEGIVDDQKCKDCESEARWSQASTATVDDCETASDVLDACSSSEAAGASAGEEEKLAVHDVPVVAEYDTACAVIKFQSEGPKGMGLLTVTFKHVSISPDSFGEALKTLALVTREHIHADFATMFDISRLIVPSPFILPRLLSTVKEHLVHLDSWREYQQAFSVVRGDSSLFNAIVSAFGALSRAKNKPVFAKNQAEAYELLSQLP